MRVGSINYRAVMNRFDYLANSKQQALNSSTAHFVEVEIVTPAPPPPRTVAFERRYGEEAPPYLRQRVREVRPDEPTAKDLLFYGPRRPPATNVFTDAYQSSHSDLMAQWRKA